MVHAIARTSGRYAESAGGEECLGEFSIEGMARGIGETPDKRKRLSYNPHGSTELL